MGTSEHTDSRGASRSIPTEKWLRRLALHDRRARRLWRLRRAAGRARRMRWGMWVSVSLLALCVLGLAVAVFKGMLGELWIGVLITVLVGAAALGFREASSNRRGLEWLQREIARAKLCPCCGYDLQGLEAQEDGCVVCPECGAAWWMGESNSSRLTVHRSHSEGT